MAVGGEVGDARDLLETVGISEKADQYPADLSGGDANDSTYWWRNSPTISRAATFACAGALAVYISPPVLRASCRRPLASNDGVSSVRGSSIGDITAMM